MKNKTLSLVLALIMMLTLAPAVLAQAETDPIFIDGVTVEVPGVSGMMIDLPGVFESYFYREQDGAVLFLLGYSYNYESDPVIIFDRDLTLVPMPEGLTMWAGFDDGDSEVVAKSGEPVIANHSDGITRHCFTVDGVMVAFLSMDQLPPKDFIYGIEGSYVGLAGELAEVGFEMLPISDISTDTLTTAPAAPREITILLNGEKLEFDVKPQIMNGRTMVPLRAVFLALGVLEEDIVWDAGTRTATVTKGDTVLVLPIGSTSPTVNGEEVEIDQPAVIVEGRTLAPIRFAAEVFGGIPDWDPATRTGTITMPDMP